MKDKSREGESLKQQDNCSWCLNVYCMLFTRLAGISLFTSVGTLPLERTNLPVYKHFRDVLHSGS